MHSAVWQNVCGFMTDVYESLEREDASLRHLFECMCQHGNAAFSLYSEGGKWQRIRYRDLPGLCAGAASRLDGLLSGKDGLVALHLPNCAQWPLIFWALVMSGRTPLLLNAALPLSAFEGILKREKVQAVISREEGEGIIHPHQLIDRDKPGEMGLFNGRWGDQLVFMTSGTTGTPKLLVYNGRCMVQQIQACRYFYRETTEIAYPASEGIIRQLAILPFSHIFGFVICMIWYPHFGSTIVYPSSLRPDELMQCCREQKVTHLCAVPSLYDMLVRALCQGAARLLGGQAESYIRYLRQGGYCSPEDALRYQHYSKKLCLKALGSGIRYLISGGGMLSPETAGFFNRMGLYFCNGYGMTELGVLAVELSQDPAKRMQCAIGAPAYGVSFQLDEENQLLADCRYGAIGSLEMGEIIPLPRPFPTQDMARKLEDGRYVLKGRQDDIIVDRNGSRFHPQEVEEHFRGLSGVSDLCVIGHQDQLIALLEVSPMTDREMLAAAFNERNSNAPLSMYVQKAHLLAHLPRSPKGELQRQKIREQYLQNPDGEEQLLLARRNNIALNADFILDAILVKAAELLNQPLENVLPNANFFTELGGDSLAYLCLVQWMEGRFHVKLDGRDYQRPDTLSQWAEIIKTKEGLIK